MEKQFLIYIVVSFNLGFHKYFSQFFTVEFRQWSIILMTM